MVGTRPATRDDAPLPEARSSGILERRPRGEAVSGGYAVVFLRFGLVPLVLMALWLYAIFDVIATDESLMRNLPKPVWLLIVIFLPDVGSLAWLLLGRPLYAGWRPGDTTRRAPKRAIGPEDRDDFPTRPPRPLPSREDELTDWEERLRRREEELRRREQGDADEPPAGS